MSILMSITLASEHIFQVLAQYLLVLSQYLTSIVTILASIEQVNTPLVTLYKPYKILKAFRIFFQAFTNTHRLLAVAKDVSRIAKF